MECAVRSAEAFCLAMDGFSCGEAELCRLATFKEGNLIRYIKIRQVSTIRLKSLLHCGVHVVRHSEEEKGSVISYASIHSSYYFSSSLVSLNSVYLFGCRVTVTDLHICTDHFTVQCMLHSQSNLPQKHNCVGYALYI